MLVVIPLRDRLIGQHWVLGKTAYRLERQALGLDRALDYSIDKRPQAGLELLLTDSIKQWI